MLKNYFKIAIRNIIRYKTYSIINILGLSIGIAAFLMVSLYVVNEFTVDRFNENYDNIYRIEAASWFHVPAPLIPIIRQEMPDLEAVAPTERKSVKIQYNNNYSEYLDNVIFTEADFFDIFTIDIISGIGKSALEEPYKLLLSEREAQKIFGDENAIGKQITVDKKFTFTIAGIFRDFPDNSHLFFNALSSFQNRKIMTEQEDFYDNWSNWNYQTYIRLSDGKNPQETLKIFNSAFNKEMAEIDPYFETFV
ncbi:MAG: ABC transporter permease [Candidatus Cloacimonetes bacterium]|nr:ABC transporter permease [Candidatus Cloacimonadota bacterium]